MSARFPVISPHGSIIGVDGRVVDRVVDGGYYENFGATTALELARELVVRWGLVSTIVVVNNEPTEHRLGCGVEADPAAAAGTTPQSRLFSMVTAPLGAVINTRTARGSYAAVELCRYIRSETALRGEFTFITVKPSGAKPLSMSWWLSKYVQQYLDLHLAVPPGGTEPTMRDRAFTGVNQDALQLIEERRRMR